MTGASKFYSLIEGEMPVLHLSVNLSMKFSGLDIMVKCSYKCLKQLFAFVIFYFVKKLFIIIIIIKLVPFLTLIKYMF